MSYQQDISKNIVAIINGFDYNIYHEQEKEDLAILSTNVLQKKLKKLE